MQGGSRAGKAGRAASVVMLVLAALAAPGHARAGGREIVVRAGGEAALAPPMVAFELRTASGRPLEAEKDELLDGLLDGIGGVAVLDTGASGTVLSGATAARYGIAAESGARFVEVGMSGEHPMGVSRPYTLAVCKADGTRRGAGCADTLLLRTQRFLLNEPKEDLAALLSPGAATDVIGMPAIREAVVELRNADGGAAPLGVVIHPRGARIAAAHWIALAMVDFNRRRHPANRGPLPDLAVNPMIRGVRVRAGGRTAAGDWLLDTGAVVTIVSSVMARAVGLVDSSGRPTREPDFSLPIGGISGAQQALPGFRLERLELDAEDGTTIVVERPAVLVHDIVTTTDDGVEHRLDGILGMNVLAGSGSGMTLAGFAETHAPAFERVVIDGPRSRLGLTPSR